MAIGMGAFAAHGLGIRLEASGLSPDRLAERLATFETAARYQLAIAVVLLFLAPRTNVAIFRRSFGMFLAGTVIFSGSLYLLVLLDQSWLGAVTPIGGLLLILAWLSLLFVSKTKTADERHGG